MPGNQRSSLAVSAQDVLHRFLLGVRAHADPDAFVRASALLVDQVAVDLLVGLRRLAHRERSRVELAVRTGLSSAA